LKNSLFKNMNVLNYFAFSKINLGLQVQNLREDGYHNINTVFYLINLSDEIIFKESDIIKIETIPDLGIHFEDNLIYKAGKIFLKTYNISGGFEAIVKKNIPSGGGLGGGSSDAATTVIALNRMYKTEAPYSILLEIVNKVGSDCAFFVSGSRMAKATSRGEKLKYLHAPLSCNIAIVNPGIHVSTPLAYKLLNRTNEAVEEIDFVSILEQYHNKPLNFRERITNDFEDVVFDLHPEIRNIKEKLYSIGADFALMSGSGSTVFGLFTRDIDILELQAEFPNYFCHISR
jgi:4-diphosphocytidyl-2-C-methyl-D-erythritol kinase